MIAEFMLHRTKADQVVPVYEKFIKKYPNVYSVSRASEEEIRKVTDHLGLHWRSAHFTMAAKVVADTFNGNFPDRPDELLRIPGVGEYVAGAILTICFDKIYPVVDANIARFINRFYGLNLSGELRRKRKIIEISKSIYKSSRTGQLTFALLDFTGLICKPIKPVCNFCILKMKCNYRKIHI